MIPGIDPSPTTAWLQARIPELEPPLGFELIVGGHSNLTYKVTDHSGRRWVLRRPTLGAVLATAHDMGREHRIIAALARTAVPVPPARGYCDDHEVNGAPFYVMDFVDGVVLDGPEPVAAALPDSDLGVRERLGFAVVDTLAALHAVDPNAVGLGDLGKKDGYLDRQLRRWSIQWQKSKTRELPVMEETHAALVATRPEQRYTGVVHGDYRLGNMLSRTDGTVAAVLDWELCTLGDTLADVGYLLNSWTEPGDDAVRGSGLGPTAAGGFPTRAQIRERYSALTGRDLAGIDYYCAFQMWRLAAICEGVYARYQQGVMGDQDYDDQLLRGRVERLAEGAWELASGTPG